jgi:hypothetical protein
MRRKPDRRDGRSRIGTLIILLLAGVPSSAGTAGGISPGGETFYLVVYAAQEEGNHPETSHCFATFARVEEAREAGPVVELHHINWFSLRGHRTGATHALFEDDGTPTRPEPGENRTTREALLLASRHGLRISRWGPFEIEQELYNRALRQIDLLEGRVPGRRVLYKSCDIGCREPRGIVALNCVHAVSDVDRESGPLRTWTKFGEQAARLVVQHLGRWIKEPARDHPEAWKWIWRETWGPGPAPDLQIAQGASPFHRDTPALPTSRVQARTKPEGGPGPRRGRDDSLVREGHAQEGGN